MISIDNVKVSIGYLYLLFYGQPSYLKTLCTAGQRLLAKQAMTAGVTEREFRATNLPLACRRIVEFQQASREADEAIVSALTLAALNAEQNPISMNAFRTQMELVTNLAGRAKADNRLHRKKGCQFCNAACRYGYFTLVSDPDFKVLQHLYAEEKQKPTTEQDVLYPAWKFAGTHLTQVYNIKPTYLTPAEFGNLSYCLLMLSMAKSRLPMPEEQLKHFQEANRKTIRRLELV